MTGDPGGGAAADAALAYLAQNGGPTVRRLAAAETVRAELNRLAARVAELEAFEATTEWAVVWPGPGDIAEYGADEKRARREARRWRDEGAEAARREVRYGPWQQVPS
jgi:hypothetical protein